MNTVVLRCQSCGAANRVLKDKLSARPKCGKCDTALIFLDIPVDVTDSLFQEEVLNCPEAVLVEFWSPT